MAAIPALDPAAPKGRLFRMSEGIVQTKPGRWFAIHVASRLDPVLLRATKGRMGTFPTAKVVLLTVPGRKSGEPRTAPLLYFTDDGDVIVIASSFGREHHPAWYHNVKAHPEVGLRLGKAGGTYRAEEIADETERARLYDRARSLYDGYDGYEVSAGAAGRRIPVFRMRPVDVG